MAMVRRFFWLPLIFVPGLLFLAIGSEAVSEPVSGLEQAAADYEAGNYERALELYVEALASFPGDPCAIWMQAGVAKAYVALGDDPNAEAALGVLMADYSASPHIARAVHQVACEYYDFQRHKAANVLRRYIIANWPNDDCAMWSAMDLITTDIKLGRYDDALEAVEGFVAQYGANEHVTEGILAIGRHFGAFKQHEDAIAVLEMLITDFPGDSFTEQARFHLARANSRLLIEQGADVAADAQIAALAEDFRADPNLPEVLSAMGKRYVELRDFARARNIYQRTAMVDPNGDAGRKAQLRVRMIDVLPLIDAGEHNTAFAELGRIVADFNDNPDLPWALSRIAGEQYYRNGITLGKQGYTQVGRENMVNALSLWQTVADEFSESEAAGEACHWLGDGYRKLSDYESSAHYYERVAEVYSDYHMRWHTMFVLGRDYQSMAKAGLITKRQADRKTKAIYERLIDRYPNCKAARAARHWLGIRTAN